MRNDRLPRQARDTYKGSAEKRWRFRRNFLGGLLGHAKGMCALTNPTVNSYKRLNADPTVSGASWAPNTISYTGNNRTHMIRLPDAPRFELRLADAAVNPYLLPAAIAAAGLDGMATKADPGEMLMCNMYSDDPDAVKAKAERETLPLYLIDALREFEDDTVRIYYLLNPCVA
jgi:glutamine synthetase